ncbi:MAG TPA: ABC transporter substrate-binding protein [Geminicoccaceae bacterium]|nr:ABC transporter substrate-binding protein [Geminicoccaceae bacterium]
MIKRRALALLAGAAAVLAQAGTASAQQQAEKPAEILIGIATFLSGSASVFGVPGQNAAEILIERMNQEGGIGGVPVRAIYIDEAPGADHVVSEYRRLVQNEGVDVTLAAISSGTCMAIGPVAEDLEQFNIMWDCGTQRIFEENDYKYSFRTQGYATAEMLAALFYLLKHEPDFQSIAVVNQDYAWGRESWEIFHTALEALKPDVRVVAELFPRFGAPDYSTEISRLSALRPDIVLSTSWGGDLDTFVRQAAERGLMNQSTFVLPLAESSLERLGDVMPDGHIVGGRGDHYFLHPEYRDDEELQRFVEAYRERTGEYPIYPTFHMAAALSALKAAYEKAIEANGGGWPATDDLIAAMEGLEFRGLTRPVTIREDHQGLEDQLIGVTAKSDEYPFAVIDQMVIFPSEILYTPVGQISVEWLKTLTPDVLDKVPEPVSVRQ